MRIPTLLAVLLLTATAGPAPAWAQDAAPAAAAPITNLPSYDQDTPVERLAGDPAAAAVLNKDLPGLLGDAQYHMFKSMSLKELQRASGGDLSQADVDKTVADLQALFPH